MKKRTLIALGLGSFLVASIPQLPARLLLSVIPENPFVNANTISGTLLQGALSNVRWQQWHISTAHWDLQPLSLLGGKVSAKIRGTLQPAGYFAGECGMGLGGSVQCTTLDIKQLPAKTLSPSLSKLRVPPLAGTFTATLNDVAWDRQGLPEGTGRIEWQGAGIQLTPQRFGDYAALLTTGDSGARVINLTSKAGAAFQLGGNVIVSDDGRYKTNLKVQASEQVNAATERFMQNILGQPQADGSFQLQKEGQLNLPQAN